MKPGETLARSSDCLPMAKLGDGIGTLLLILVLVKSGTDSMFYIYILSIALIFCFSPNSPGNPAGVQ